METNTPAIRDEIVNAIIEKVNSYEKPVSNDNDGDGIFLSDQFVEDTDEYNRFLQKIVFDNESLTKDEKTYLTNTLNINVNYFIRRYNRMLKPQICGKCKQECMDGLIYCKRCIQNYLKTKFSTWTSGNKEIDDLIQKCQMEAQGINGTIEWVPYDRFRNVEYLTKGGSSEIYKAEWVEGPYVYLREDTEEREYMRIGQSKIILKKLSDIEDAKRSWYEEALSHMSISNKCSSVIDCFGLTQNPSSGEYFLIMLYMDTDLRNYLRLNHNKIKWKERIKIVNYIIDAVFKIHHENAIHRDLHSGNVLATGTAWLVGDLGLCGPVNKPLGSIYGNLPYVAPEIFCGKKQTYASDVYSIGILMWEVSSGQPPYNHIDHDYGLALKIIDGMRPKTIPGTPVEYERFMQKCWDADPLKRPDIYSLRYNFDQFYQSFVPNEVDDQLTNNEIPKESNIIQISKVYHFKEIPKPANANEAEATHNLDEFTITEEFEEE